MIAPEGILILLIYPNQEIIIEMAALQFIEAEIGVITGLVLGTILGADDRTHIMVIHHKGATIMIAGETLQAGVATTTTLGFPGAEEVPG